MRFCRDEGPRHYSFSPLDGDVVGFLLVLLMGDEAQVLAAGHLQLQDWLFSFHWGCNHAEQVNKYMWKIFERNNSNDIICKNSLSFAKSVLG